MRTGQNCHRTAGALIFNHSVYDMSNTDITDCMDAHKSFIAYGAVMFSSEILFCADGQEGELKMYQLLIVEIKMF